MPSTNVKGLKELADKLSSMEKKVAGKTLRSSVLQASTPAMKKMKSSVPRGKKSHRTYKGRLVAPGFLSRSIKRRTTYRNGVARVVIGVKKEAFYGVLFVEPGTEAHRIPSRGKAKLRLGNRIYANVNHPGSKPHPWFKSSFVSSERAMTERLATVLRKKVMEAAR